MHRTGSSLGLLQVQRVLQQRASVDARDSSGKTALMGAAWHGNREVCAVLLQNRAMVNERDPGDRPRSGE